MRRILGAWKHKTLGNSTCNLTICIFGQLTDTDRAALDERYELKVLTKEEVFTGGYDEAETDSGVSDG